MVAGALIVLSTAWLLQGCGSRATPVEPIGADGLKPTERDPNAGLVGIRGGLDLGRYRSILVERFPVDEALLTDAKKRELASAFSVTLQERLLWRLRYVALFESVVDPTAVRAAEPPEPALRLQGKITRVGTLPTQVQVEMYFFDVGTGQVMLVTADRRTTGTREADLKATAGAIADDLVRFLEHLVRGRKVSAR